MEIFDYQIIANLLSGKGLAKIRLEELENFLDEKGVTYRTLAIAKQTPISLLPTDGEVEIKKGVICLGGDGTVSETIGYMIKRKILVPIFIVPTGTANFLAEAIGVRTNIRYDKLFHGQIKKYDLGVYQDKDREDYFLIGIGFGFEQRFLAMAKDKSKRFFGKIAYYWAALSELLRLKPLAYQVVIDEKKLKFNSAMVTILNLKPRISLLLPLFLEKDILVNDGLLDFIYVEHQNYWYSFLGIFLFYVFGSLDFGLVKRMKAKEIKISCSELSKSQIDGELKGELPFKISILPAGVTFLV